MKTVKQNPHTLDLTARISQRCYPFIRLVSGAPSARKYNLSISHRYRFIWFRVAKNGTRTLLESLKNNAVPLDVLEARKVRYSLGKYKDYYKFAVARNPWARLVSCWLDKVVRKNAFGFQEKQYQEMKTFSAFVEFVSGVDIDNCNCHFASQSSLIDLNELDYLARMETYEYDIGRIFAEIGVNDFSLTVKNVSSGRAHYTQYYTRQLRDKVYDIYKKDIQLFGYTYS